MGAEGSGVLLCSLLGTLQRQNHNTQTPKQPYRQQLTNLHRVFKVLGPNNPIGSNSPTCIGCSKF